MAKKSQKERKDISNIIDFFRDKKVQFICGVVLFFIMVYISLALVSFVYTGKNDQSVLAEYKAKKIEYNHRKSQRPLSDEDKDNLRLIRRELQEIQKKAENVTGYRGAFVSENLLRSTASIRYQTHIGMEMVLTLCFRCCLGIVVVGFCCR